MIQLKAIKFNYDPLDAKHSALNIRRNRTQFIPVPEWVQGISHLPEDAPAAYALSETRGQQVFIQARFTGPPNARIRVRTLDTQLNTTMQTGCIGFIIRCILALLRIIVGNVLGTVKPAWIQLDASGDSGFVTLTLRQTQLANQSVGIHQTDWRWQYQTKKKWAWIDIANTRHKIYLLLEIPKLPWQQTPYAPSNDQLPWTEILDYACAWAWPARTLDEAATNLTQRIYALGPAIVQYDCPNGGASHYSAGGNFQLTAFLDRLKGGPGLGQYINCSDCATILSSFANSVGCDLWQSRMGYSFDLNEILAIGSSTWQTACGWGGFSYHEVAWKDDCDVDNEVFDACLQIDADANPTGGAPHTALLPVNLKFGNTGDGLYRDRLATSAGRPNCAPQPTTRTRRNIQ